MRAKIILSLFALSAFWSSCKDNAHREQAVHFLSAFYAGKFEEAKIYASPRTDTLLDMFIRMAPEGGMPSQTIDEKALEASMQEPMINNDTCVIRYQHPFDKQRTEEVTLFKLDNKWFVEMSLDRIDPETMNALKQASLPLENAAAHEGDSLGVEAHVDSNVVIDVK